MEMREAFDGDGPGVNSLITQVRKDLCLSLILWLERVQNDRNRKSSEGGMGLSIEI